MNTYQNTQEQKRVLNLILPETDFLWSRLSQAFHGTLPRNYDASCASITKTIYHANNAALPSLMASIECCMDEFCAHFNIPQWYVKDRLKVLRHWDEIDCSTFNAFVLI